MNYEARIAGLKAKGVLDENDADILQKSLEQKFSALPRQRRYTLETIGLILFGIFVFCLAMQVGLVENNGQVEDVGRTLNSVRVGVSGSHAFLLLVLGFCTIAFLGLYALIHHYYNKMWRLQEQMTATGILIAELEERQKEMHARLQDFSSQSKSGRKSATTAMRITSELDRELGELQRGYGWLQAECRRRQGVFPYTLAAMAGTLPRCQ